MSDNTALVLLMLGVLAAAVALIMTGHAVGYWMLFCLGMAIFL